MLKRTALITAFVLLFSTFSALPVAAAECNTVSRVLNSCPPPPPPSQPSPPPPSQSSPPPSSSQPRPSSQPPSQPPSQPSSQPSSQPAPAAGEVAGAAHHLLDLVNRERAAAGLRPLGLRDDVSDISRGHSSNMARERRIWHNDAYFTAAVRQRLGARGLGENVAMNTSVDSAHRALMDSPGHRSNILNAQYGTVGLSVVRDDRGVVYVTQNFVIPGEAPATSADKPAPKCKAKGKLWKRSCGKSKMKVKAKFKAKAKARR